MSARHETAAELMAIALDNEAAFAIASPSFVLRIVRAASEDDRLVAATLRKNGRSESSTE